MQSTVRQFIVWTWLEGDSFPAEAVQEGFRVIWGQSFLSLSPNSITIAARGSWPSCCRTS
jgi:hypothetical protein